MGEGAWKHKTGVRDPDETSILQPLIDLSITLFYGLFYDPGTTSWKQAPHVRQSANTHHYSLWSYSVLNFPANDEGTDIFREETHPL
ncbi:hypothetical protein NPIL_223261 [Nephila pilipes]|uniref:Uncharacterized protein n=1 Tax=Nephila pilipes TaxID=299642 RepID=A0A8X6K1W7_NEPPI|nr:hypothetical protein NPIL_223261 [Nephila pilipes]